MLRAPSGVSRDLPILCALRRLGGCTVFRRYLDVSEAARYLDMSERWMYRESRKHGIPRYYFGGRLRFKLDDLDRWVKQQRVA
ncbi:helix-turn-helix domain-containing protein [Streptomyces cyaneofuscatus]|uniref:helix-turn-helix domain-containing protein n=1 Tax=Streptomyces cyaneofuscatus TaxID=66883 RepID=UPI0036DB1C6C